MIVNVDNVEHMFLSFIYLHELCEQIQNKTFMHIVSCVWLKNSESQLEGNLYDIRIGLF